jgi:diguanylate cyclase (GGDEF)-like protein
MQKKRFNNQPLFKTMSHCFGVMSVAFFLLCQPLFANSLIKSLPTQLDQNWLICSQFKTEKEQCESGTLPLAKQTLAEGVSSQTFTTQFVLSREVKRKPLGLWLEQVDEVDEVYLNQQLIGRTGRLRPAFESGLGLRRLYLLPDDLLKYNQTNQIKIKTFSSKNYAGIQVKAPLIGDYLQLEKQKQNNKYLSIILISCLVLLSMFHWFYFAAFPERKETLYFAAFLITCALVTLSRSPFPVDWGINLSAMFKLESFIQNIALIFATLFAFSFFDIEIKRRFKVGLILLGFSGLAITLWPYDLNLRSLTEFNAWLVVGHSFFVVGTTLMIAVWKKRPYIWPVGLTYALGLLVMTYDALLFSTNTFEHSLGLHRSIVPLYVTLLGLVISLIITHKYWLMFKGATYDHLTGTLLKPAFFQRLSEEMSRCQRDETDILLAIIDIQQVNNISQNISYIAANQQLVKISQALSQVLRPFDLICRLNDEQFCICVTLQHEQDTDTCLQRIYDVLEALQNPDEQSQGLFLQTRIGAVIYQQQEHLAVSQLLQDANYALAKAKSQKHNNYLLLNQPVESV